MINIVYYKKLKKIIKQVKKCRNLKHQENIIKCYENKLREEIGNDKYKFLQYSMEVETELDLNFSAFLISIIALITTCVIGVLSITKVEVNDWGVVILGIAPIVFVTLYYYATKYVRTKYMPIKYALEQIKEDFNL
ncbi:hypothetical protein [Eubacterium ventriosum]|uniref:hypothetical protein n=1 Tax=Eubacterium ventriosum TaxID=39496 RepID=UPI00265E77AB|nr:hypothetical protein [Eubacterium ventriosum]